MGLSEDLIGRKFGLDVLRAVAILLVVFYHFPAELLNSNHALRFLHQSGWIGVDLFFVLSGFLVGGQLKSQPNFGQWKKQSFNFWIKRWTRTLPLYYVVLFFYVCVKPILFQAPFMGGFNFRWLIFLQNNQPILDFGQTWSLAVEEQFYFLLPIVALALNRFRSLGWFLLILLSSIYRAYTYSELGAEYVSQLSLQDYFGTFRFSSLAALDGLCLGVFLSHTRSIWKLWSLKQRRATGFFGIVVLGASLGYFSEAPRDLIGASVHCLFVAIGMGCLLVYFESFENGSRLFNPVRRIALYSYSMYMLHMILIRAIERYCMSYNGMWVFLFYLGGVVSLSKIFYELIEKPGLRLRRFLASP